MKALLLVTLSSILFVSCQEQESEREIGRYQFGGEGNLKVIDTKTGVCYKLKRGEYWMVYDVVNREYSDIKLTKVEELTSIKQTLQK